MQTRVHIVGVGSPFGDDRAGWVATELLRTSPLVAEEQAGAVAVSCCETPASLLAQDYGDAEALVVVDAIRSGASPGTIRRLSGAELGQVQTPWSSHGLHIAEALALGQAMHALPPQVLLFGIELESADTGGETLSDSVSHALPALVQDIEREVAALLHLSPRHPSSETRRSKM
jgi:hydrogenase maturation protease